MKKSKFKYRSLNTKLRMFVTCIFIPLAGLIFILLASLVNYSEQYNLIMRNVIIASEFTFDFKKTIDHKMYKLVIDGSESFDQYDPLSDVIQAREVVLKLKKTTTNHYSLRRLDNIQQFLHNLDDFIIDIRDSKGYARNMNTLENNIYILTELIENRVHEYIYYETKNLAEIEKNMDSNIRKTITYISIGSIVLIGILWTFSIRVSKSITKPIMELCENIKMVGMGDFTIRAVESSDDEINTLSQSFSSMVSKIDSLLMDVKQEQENLRSTELKLLQAQINPHFLYNTFDTIMWLAEDNKKDEVVNMVASLSSLFRTSLSNGKDIITLKDEELHVRSYLEIQKARYNDILEYEIHIDPDLYLYSIPKLTLQPLVENALYHGIKNKRSKGCIRIKSVHDNDCLKLYVSDDGIGISPERLDQLNNSRSEESVGFGLANVKERIKRYYGKEYGIHIDSIYGECTDVIVILPYKGIQPLS